MTHVQEQPKRAKPWLVTLGALLLVSLLTVVLWIQSGKEPDVAAARQHSANIGTSVEQPARHDAAPPP